MKATSKRRKGKAQLKEEKILEERKQNEIVKKLASYEQMEQRAKEAEACIAEKEHYQQMLGGLYENGIIKQEADGTFVAVEDPVERESIRSKSKQKTQQHTKAQGE